MNATTGILLRAATLSLCLWVPGIPFPAPAAFFPDYFRLQFAGSQGLLSLGAGKSFLGGKVETQLDYGFAPAWATGEPVHILSHKTTFAPWRLDTWERIAWFPASIGYSAHIALGDEYFLILQKKYRDYYWPSALHFRAFAGTKLLRKHRASSFLTATAFVLEIGALDSYWIAYFRNRILDLGDILSVACAFQFHVSLSKPAKLASD